jgi:hypothetical protein
VKKKKRLWKNEAEGSQVGKKRQTLISKTGGLPRKKKQEKKTYCTSNKIRKARIPIWNKFF